MTRKDYEMLAAALATARPASFENWRTSSGERYQYCKDCEAICDAIAANNPAFDRALFLRNCGVIS